MDGVINSWKKLLSLLASIVYWTWPLAAIATDTSATALSHNICMFSRLSCQRASLTRTPHFNISTHIDCRLRHHCSAQQRGKVTRNRKRELPLLHSLHFFIPMECLCHPHRLGPPSFIGDVLFSVIYPPGSRGLSRLTV